MVLHNCQRSCQCAMVVVVAAFFRVIVFIIKFQPKPRSYPYFLSKKAVNSLFMRLNARSMQIMWAKWIKKAKNITAMMMKMKRTTIWIIILKEILFTEHEALVPMQLQKKKRRSNKVLLWDDFFNLYSLMQFFFSCRRFLHVSLKILFFKTDDI